MLVWNLEECIWVVVVPILFLLGNIADNFISAYLMILLEKFDGYKVVNLSQIQMFKTVKILDL